MTNWKEYKLGEIGTIARGKSKHRPRDASFLYGGKYPFIQTGDVKSANHKLFNYSQTYSEDGLKQSKLWPKGTICITIAANIADTAILTFPACFPDSVIGFIADDEMCNIDFVEYLLQFYRMQIKTHSIGSVQDNINLGTFEKIKFRIPDLPTQTAIAEILSSLDDKIELNNKINQELENLAQTLFKQWFIDFEFPNQNGEPYKSSGGEMIDSELGEIPKGWEVGSIYDISDVIYGAPFKSKLFNQENKGLPLIRIRDLKTFQPQNWTEEIHPKGTKIYAGDLVVGMDAEFRAHFWLGQPAWLNQRLCHFRPKTTFSKLFVREIIKPQLAFHENSSVGTTVIHLGKGDIDTFKSLIPVNNILLQFEELSNSIFDTIINNSKESQELTKLRNTLLPKLISGELELNNHNF